MSEKELTLGFGGNELRRRARYEGPEPWDRRSNLSVVGEPHPRLDARDKVTGRARYSADVRFEGLIYGRVLGSPYAAAVAKKVDLAKAKALPGVLYAEAYEGSVLRYAGQRVAALAAVSEQVLDDAFELIDVEYERLPHVLTTDEARKPGAPNVKRDGGNVRQGRGSRRGSQAQAKRAHESADVVLEKTYRTQVQTHSCLEPHGSVSRWEGDRLTVWASTQATFAFKMTLAGALRMSPARIDVVTEHMGGGFGSKFGADAWDAFAARAAKATGRPCKLLLDRKLEHLVAGNRPDSIQNCTFSVSKDGTLKGAEVTSYGTGGVGRGAGVFNPGIYRFEGSYSNQHDVFTNAGSSRAFRAPRHPQGVFALEGMIDELAEAIGMDPLELRKKNDPHPVRLAQYEIGAKEIGWSRRKKSGSGAGPIKRGFGMASARWAHNGRPGTVVSCRIAKDGSVLVANGAQDIGTGTRTVLATVVAEELGLPVKAVDVRIGHTTDPVGPASGGSVTAPSIAPPARQAAWNAKRALLEAVAAAVGGEAEDMNLADGKVTGAPRELTFAQACGLMQQPAVEGTGRGRRSDFRLPRFTREVAGVQFAEVEVDVELGTVKVVKVVAVQDCGLVINPLLARSQINGAVIQGVSYALFEQRLLDPATGAMVNPNLLDYKIAGAVDMPEIVSIPFTVTNGISSTSTSSLGEPPAVPTAGAIANAVSNAIGARVRSLPITPETVLAALDEARDSAPAEPPRSVPGDGKKRFFK